VNFNDIQDPATRIQDQSILSMVFIAAAKLDFKILCNYRVKSINFIQIAGKLHGTERTSLKRPLGLRFIGLHRLDGRNDRRLVGHDRGAALGFDLTLFTGPALCLENLYLILGQLLNESVAGYSCAGPDI